MISKDTIRDYYFLNFNKLSLDKQFHFCSRLWLWSGDNIARKFLDEIYQPWSYGSHSSIIENLHDLGQNAKSPSPTDSPVNALNLRAPYFARYPKIKLYNSVLSHINFLQSVYDQDFSDQFYKIFPREEVLDFCENISHDREALKFLATYALNFLHNFIYLVEKTDTLPHQLFVDIAKNDYDTTDKSELQILIYFVAHVILGESLFYRRRVDNEKYHKMIVDLEKIIALNFEKVNMDSKFEFLVCAELVNYKSTLYDMILAEAKKSISTDGIFIVDRFNNNPQEKRTDFVLSEHRNVLAIMSETPTTLR